MAAARLSVRDLDAGYDATQVLRRVTFDAGAAERLAVLGRNGMGKTTLLATLMGLTTRQNGSIQVDDVEVTSLGASGRARLGLGYVPQTRCIFKTLTVEENLKAGLKDRSRSALEEAYQMFPRLAERRGHFGSQLSGGEQQMLSMARTLLGKPSILLLDEPLEGLAPVICDQLMAAINALAGRGDMTVILVEQQIERALDFADRVLVFERGSLAWDGTPAHLRADEAAIERLLGVGIR